MLLLFSFSAHKAKSQQIESQQRRNMKLPSFSKVIFATWMLSPLVQASNKEDESRRLDRPDTLPPQASPKAKAIFQYWTAERVASAVPRDYEIDSATGKRKLRTRSRQGTVADGDWTAGGAINDAAGRLLFSLNGNNYVCSGSVINDNGTPGRSLVATAAHCTYDEVNNVFATNFLFIPQQDDGQTDGSNRKCSDDKFGCWAMEFAVIDSHWRDGSWSDIIPYDYAVLVVPDSGSHAPGYDNSNPVLDSAVTPMDVDFTNEQNLQDGSLGQFHGYSYNQDPNFRYCHQTLDARTDRWEIPGCLLSGGASGGPCQPDPAGNGKLFTVVSYSYSNGGVQQGMGGARLNNNAFSCVYETAKTAALDSSGEVISYGGSPCPITGPPDPTGPTPPPVTASPVTAPPTLSCFPSGFSCISDSDCCSNKCKGPSGGKSCKG